MSQIEGDPRIRESLKERWARVDFEIRDLRPGRLHDVFLGIVHQEQPAGEWDFAQSQQTYHDEQALVAAQSNTADPDFERTYGKALDVLDARVSIKPLIENPTVVPILVQARNAASSRIYGVALPVNPQATREMLIVTTDNIFNVAPSASDPTTLGSYTNLFNRDTGNIGFFMDPLSIRNPYKRQRTLRDIIHPYGAMVREPGDTIRSLAKLADTYETAVITLSRAPCPKK